MNLQAYQQLLSVAEKLTAIDPDSFDAEEMIDLHTISDRLNCLINQSHHSLSRNSYRFKAAKAKLEALEAEYSTNPASELRLLDLLGIE